MGMEGTENLLNTENNSTNGEETLHEPEGAGKSDTPEDYVIKDYHHRHK